MLLLLCTTAVVKQILAVCQLNAGHDVTLAVRVELGLWQCQ